MTTENPTIPVRFTGDAREYFGIFIVNLLLSIVTLGIYSAWAKVRNKKYFLGNTTIDGRPFDYHARGQDILVGRVVVVAAFVLYTWLSSISPAANGILTVLVLAVAPWLINRGLRFNAAMTSWSNVRFRFDGNYWPAFRVFLLYPFLAIFTLYLALPFVMRALIRYTVGRHRLGGHRFAFESGIGPFYAAFAWTGLWAIGGLALAVGLVAINGFAGRVLGSEATDGPFGSFGILVLFVAAIIAFVALFPLATIYAAFIRNARYAGTTLEGGHRFVSGVSAIRLVWISISNAVLTVVSLGMLLPWARIRVARYLCAHTWVQPVGSLDEFVSEAERRQTAIGDAFLDIEGIDVGAAV